MGERGGIGPAGVTAVVIMLVLVAASAGFAGVTDKAMDYRAVFQEAAS